MVEILLRHSGPILSYVVHRCLYYVMIRVMFNSIDFIDNFRA